MADCAEHDVLLVEHRADPRLHRIMRFDQAADILRARYGQRFLRHPGAAEPPRALGQRVERAGDPPQDEIEQAYEYQKQYHRLHGERADDGAVALGQRQAGHLPCVAPCLPQPHDEKIVRCRPGSGLEPWAAFCGSADQFVIQQRALEDDEVVDIDPLRGQNIRQFGFALGLARLPGNQRRLACLAVPDIARKPDAALSFAGG